MADPQQLTLTRPDDWHLHVRDGATLASVVPDTARQFARAIMAAEQESAAGVLRVVHWRGGKTQDVQLKLAVMGAYSKTAPYNCAKSRKILEQGCQAIAKKGLDKVSIPNDLNALALLASGRPVPVLSPRALVAAEADGQPGHGLSRLPSYAAQAASGKVDVRKIFEYKRDILFTGLMANS